MLSQRSVRTFLFILGLALPQTALALGIQNFSQGDPFYVIQNANPLSQADTFLCISCDAADFAALTPLAGYQKSPVRTLAASSAELRKLPSQPTFQGFVDGAGNEFQADAQLIAPPLAGGASFLCGFPGPGFCGVIGHLESDRTFVFDAGETVHELSDGSSTWVLYLELNTVGLATMILPPGWSYASRTLSQALVLDSGGFPDIYTDVQGNLWQLQTVPEPGLAWLALGIAAAASWLRRSPAGTPAAAR